MSKLVENLTPFLVENPIPFLVANTDFRDEEKIVEVLKKQTCSLCFKAEFLAERAPEWLSGIAVDKVIIEDPTDELESVARVLKDVRSVKKIRFYWDIEILNDIVFIGLKNFSSKYNIPIIFHIVAKRGFDQEIKNKNIGKLFTHFNKVTYYRRRDIVEAINLREEIDFH